MVVEAIRDCLMGRLSDRHDLKCDQENGIVMIWWTHRISNRKRLGNTRLAYQFTTYVISLLDGCAVVDLGFGEGISIGLFDYSDPSFPDNLINSLPPVDGG